ncbi:hypothetical protein pipiens_000268, partial [Culex pipiens pipiens]
SNLFADTFDSLEIRHTLTK